MGLKQIQEHLDYMRNRTDGQGMALLAESSSPSFDVISCQVTLL